MSHLEAPFGTLAHRYSFTKVRMAVGEKLCPPKFVGIMMIGHKSNSVLNARAGLRKAALQDEQSLEIKMSLMDHNRLSGPT